MADKLILRIVFDAPVSSEELADSARHLKDHLNELPGVEATELVEAAAPGTRDPFHIVFGTLTLAAFAYPRAKQAMADLRHLAEVIKRYQERNKGKRLKINLPDGTEIDVRDVSEETLAEVLKSVSVPRQGEANTTQKVEGN